MPGFTRISRIEHLKIFHHRGHGDHSEREIENRIRAEPAIVCHRGQTGRIWEAVCNCRGAIQFVYHRAAFAERLRRFAAYWGAKNDIDVVRVPGAFEIPSAARTLAVTGKYDAIICIGCLLRGDTAHYDVIVNEVTRGIGQSAQETGVPHAFGVLTCDTLEQAIDRAGLKMGNKGFEAALAAVEMASLKKLSALSHQPSARSRVLLLAPRRVGMTRAPANGLRNAE